MSADGSATTRAAQHLARTDRGRAVLQDRAVPLSRAARNLLLLLDPAQAAGHWLSLVRGSSDADLQTLLGAGLVAAVPLAAPVAVVDVAGVPVPRFTPALSLHRLDQLDYSTLSARLTAQARPRLGLVQGFRAVLDIERASDAAALREVAHKLVAQVQASQGDAAAQDLSQALTDGTPPAA
jgi:hypothetical protein